MFRWSPPGSRRKANWTTRRSRVARCISTSTQPVSFVSCEPRASVCGCGAKYCELLSFSSIWSWLVFGSLGPQHSVHGVFRVGQFMFASVGELLSRSVGHLHQVTHTLRSLLFSLQTSRFSSRCRRRFFAPSPPSRRRHWNGSTPSCTSTRASPRSPSS